MKRFLAVMLAVVLLFTLSGCSTYTYKSKDGDWSVKLPGGYTRDKQEKDDQLKVSTTTFLNKAGTEIDISESIDPKLVLDKDTLTTELKSDALFEVTGTYTVDSKAGTVYAAKAVDEVTSLNILCGIAKVNDKVVTIMAYQSPNFTQDQESRFKDMLATIRKLK